MKSRATRHHASQSLVAIAAADFDRDGFDDFFYLRNGGQSGAIALGKGDGSFTDTTPFMTGGATFAATGDLNGDQKPDLALMTPGGVAVVLNTSHSFSTVDFVNG